MTVPELLTPHPAPIIHRAEPSPLALELAGHEVSLYRAMAAIFLLGGFAAVLRATSKAQKRVARENRASVNAEGWIV